jgi:hypothetical protein
MWRAMAITALFLPRRRRIRGYFAPRKVSHLLGLNRRRLSAAGQRQNHPSIIDPDRVGPGRGTRWGPAKLVGVLVVQDVTLRPPPAAD